MTTKYVVHADYTKGAWTNHWGNPQWGYVLTEAVVLTKTDEKIRVSNGYEMVDEAIWVDSKGRRYRQHVSIDYTGGTSYVRLATSNADAKYFHVPAKTREYVMDGIEITADKLEQLQMQFTI